MRLFDFTTHQYLVIVQAASQDIYNAQNAQAGAGAPHAEEPKHGDEKDIDDVEFEEVK